MKSPLEKAYKKIITSKKKSAYVALCPDITPLLEDYCNLVTATHSAKISSGNKLEDFIYEEYTGLKHENIKFSDVLKIIEEHPNEMIVFKKVKIPKKILIDNSSHKFDRGENLHLDFLVYYNGELYINELKDGYNLDTKKSNDEINEIEMVKEVFENVTNKKCYASLILWTCENIEDASIKSAVAGDYIVIGREFAKTLNVDFDIIEYNRMTFNNGNNEFIKAKIIELADKIKNEENFENETSL